MSKRARVRINLEVTLKDLVVACSANCDIEDLGRDEIKRAVYEHIKKLMDDDNLVFDLILRG